MKYSYLIIDAENAESYYEHKDKYNNLRLGIILDFIIVENSDGSANFLKNGYNGENFMDTIDYIVFKRHVLLKEDVDLFIGV